MNNLKSFFQTSKSVSAFANLYIQHVSRIMKSLDTSQIESVITLIERSRQEKKQIFIAGNGGSAATACHFANDLQTTTRKLSPPLRAISLSSNISTVTAYANDYGYDNVFVEQLKTTFQKGDLLIVISASGNSLNLIRSVNWVKEFGGSTAGLLGFNGGELLGMCESVIFLKTEKNEYGPIEDIHLMLCHLISSYFMMNQ